MPSLPLSRVLQPSDAALLSPTLRRIVDDRFDTRAPQHNARKIEYATVLEALVQMSSEKTLTRIVDIGGAGSPLAVMVQEVTTILPQVVDPAESGADLHTYLWSCPRLCDVVLCISVIEHVADERQLLYDLAQLVVPGGWLILTMDYGASQPDAYHFHWMRERIYTLADVGRLSEALLRYRLLPWGRQEIAAHPEPLVHDYNFLSLVFQKAVTP